MTESNSFGPRSVTDTVLMRARIGSSSPVSYTHLDVYKRQLHKGPASTVQFKDVVIRPLTSFPDITGRFITRPSAAPEPSRTYKDSTKVNLPDTAMPN